MKRTILLSLLIGMMGVMAFMGCEKPEQGENPTTTIVASQTTAIPVTNPLGETTPVTHNTTLSYTGCHSNQRDSYYGEVSTNYENGVLLLNIEGFNVNCGIDSLSVVSEIDPQTINVNISEICENQTNCFCPIDVNYSIDNIKVGSYELIIIKHGLVFYQEEIICE